MILIASSPPYIPPGLYIDWPTVLCGLKIKLFMIFATYKNDCINLNFNYSFKYYARERYVCPVVSRARLYL